MTDVSALDLMIDVLTEGACLPDTVADVEETMNSAPDGEWQLILAVNADAVDSWERRASAWLDEHEGTDWDTTMDAWASAFGEPWLLPGDFDWYVTDNVDSYAYPRWCERGDVVELLRFG